MSNLLQDGYNLIDGYRLQQDAQCSEYFKRYLDIVKPKRILELGTAGGGLTKILRDHTDVPILTVEKEESIIDKRTYELADVYIEDFLDTNFAENIDYAIASGVFNLKLEEDDEYEHLYQNMEKMFNLSSKAISLDFLSDKVEYSHEHNFTFSPEKILSMAYNFSRNVSLKNTYFPFEFSITIYKDDSFMEENSVFNNTCNRLAWLR